MLNEYGKEEEKNMKGKKGRRKRGKTYANKKLS
jgi:hypothetical protein